MAAEMFAPLVADDSAQPGTEVAGDIEAAEILPCGDEGVLHEIGGGGVVAGQRPGIDEQAAVVFAGQHGEGLPVGRRDGHGIRFHELGCCGMHSSPLVGAGGKRA